MRKTLILLLLIAGCDQKKKMTPEDFRAKYQAERAALLKAGEGKTYYAARVLQVKDLNTAHARRDCPVIVAELSIKGGGKDADKNMYTEVPLTLRDGKFVDGKGDVYEPMFCDTCKK